jgi:hypothetical protein
MFFYLITGCIIHAILSVWEKREDQKLKTEVYEIILWPIAFIQYAIRSWKNIKESD